MAVYETEPMLQELERDVQEAIHQVEQEFKPLSCEQLQWVPAPGKWSINDCLEHLNIYSRYYQPRIRKQVEKGGTQRKATFKAGYFGEMMMVMKPTPDGPIRKPMSTMGSYNPIKQTLKNERALQEFLGHLYDLQDLLKLARRVNLEKHRITSTLGPILRFKLGDNYRFHIAHIQRHLLQASRVKVAQQYL
ncbi:DinB family protein [soil metagenome]